MGGKKLTREVGKEISGEDVPINRKEETGWLIAPQIS
jgi:hypothetical protein